MQAPTWNYERRPLPSGAPDLIKRVKGLNSGHPVAELFDILLQSYTHLEELVQCYNTSDDAYIPIVESLLSDWRREKIARVKERMDAVSTRNGRDSHHARRAANIMIPTNSKDYDERPAPGSPPVASPPRRQVYKQKSSAQMQMEAPDIPLPQPPAASVVDISKALAKICIESAETTRDSSQKLGRSNSQQLRGSDVSTSSVEHDRKSLQAKNAEYFKKMREDEELAKRTKLEEASRLDPEIQRQREEARLEAEKHDADKTAHFAKLGRTFVAGGRGKEGARGGRGRGRG